MTIQQTIKNIIFFLVIFIASANSGLSQMPIPTPTQIPNISGTYDPSWFVARDDFVRYTKPNHDTEQFFIRNNDDGGSYISVYSQSYNIGTMSPGNCGFGYCGSASVLDYRNVLPNGTFGSNYGVDIGYYYLTYLGHYSNLAKVTIIAVPQDDAENAGKSCPVVGHPVNVSNGNMWLEQTDFKLPGSGEEIEINRFYNSLIQTAGLFGTGWSTKYDESLQSYGNYLVRLNMPDGRAVYLARETTTAAYMPVSPEMYGFIVKNADGTFTLTFKDGRKHQFNSSGSLQWQRDRSGNQTTLNYDTNNVLTGITDASGRILTIGMSNGLVQNLSDSLGTIAVYTYLPGTSRLKDVTYQDGSKFKFEYDTTTVAGKTFLKTVKDANDKIVETHEYDSLGRATTSEKEGGVEKYTFDYSNWGLGYPNYPYTLVKHKKNASDTNFVETKYFFNKDQGKNYIWKTEGNCNCGSGSESTTFEYNDRLNLKKKTDALGRQTTYTYNYQGDVLTMTDTWGTVAYTRNEYGQVLTTTDRMGGVTTNTYDASGNIKTVTDALGKVTTVVYPTTNNKGLPDSIKDARLNVTKFKWFPTGLLQETEDAYLKKTSYTYDARGRTKTVTNALNYVTTYNYFDDAQRKVETIYPNTDKVTYKYDVRRLLESVTDGRGNLTSYEFDPAYRLKKITDPLGHAKEFDYDSMSNMKLTKDALGNQTDYLYDDFDRLKELQYPLAATGATRLVEKFEYDQVGRIKKHYDTANRLTEYGYDDANRTNTVTDALLKVTQTKYNQRFQTIEVKDALNQVYNFTNDPFGRVLTQTRAGTTMSYEYDEVGNRKKRTDYAGRVTDYIYDNLNRLRNIAYQGATDFAAYGYDDLSRLTSAMNQNGTVSFAYDNRNRMNLTTDVFAHTIEYGYDANGNRNLLKLDGATHSSYAYDTANRLTQLTDEASQNFIFDFDAANRLKTKTLPNGVVTTYNYDGMSRLKQLKHQYLTSTLFDNQFAYNAANQIDYIVELAQMRDFDYDNVNRLTSLVYAQSLGGSPSSAPALNAPTYLPNENYAYDAVGNRTGSHQSGTYGYQANNKLASTATAGYGYDANGNLISKTDATGSWTYVWDYENRMTSATNTVSGAVLYAYDVLGRRVKRTQSRQVTKFTYDGSDVLMDDNGKSSFTKYQNGLGIDDKLKMITTGGAASYFLQDHLGSTVGMTDSVGTQTSSAAYESFGKSEGNLTTRYQFTGREYDSFTGLYYYRARFYDPQLGRFVSEDPIGFAGGDVNLFGYVKNNPLNFVDPSGNQGVGYSDLMADYRAKQEAKRCEAACQSPMPPIPHHRPDWNINDNMTEATRRFPNSNWFYDQVKNDAPWDYKRQGQYFNGRSEYEDFGNFNYGATCKSWGFTSYMCRNEAGLAQNPNDDLDPGKGEAGSRFSYLFNGWLFGGWGDYGDEGSDQTCINQGISYFEAFDEKRRCGCAPK